LSYVDKTSSGFNTKTYNTDNLKYLFQSTQDDPKHTGFICDFDITGALLNGDNTLKVYLYTAQVGTGSKLSFCEIPGNVGATAAVGTEGDLGYVPANPGTPSKLNNCKYWDNYDTLDASDFTTTDGGFDLNIIQIKRNSSDNNQIDLKIGAGSWVFNLFLIYLFFY